MTPRILGLNLSLDHTLDVKVRDDFNRALQPACTVVMVDSAKDIPKVIAYQQAHRYTQVVGRVFYELDGGMHDEPKAPGDAGKRYVVSPLDWINEVGALGQGDNGWCYVMNEPDGVHASDELKDRLVSWIEEWQQLAIIRGVKSVLFNFGDRHPKIVSGQWESRYHGILRTCARHPDLFRIGLHCYGDDPLAEHLAALVATCEALGIKPIETVVTEYGLDTHNGSPDGYVARGVESVLYAGWMDTTINGELRPYIDAGVVVGICVFCWNANPRWNKFDVQLDQAWREAILDLAEQGRFDIVQTVVTKTIGLAALPDGTSGPISGLVKSFERPTTLYYQVRMEPNLEAPAIGQVHKGLTLVRRYSFPSVQAVYDSKGIKGRWQVVEVIEREGKTVKVLLRGWMCTQGITWDNTSTQTSENPVVTEPPPGPQPPLAPAPDEAVPPKEPERVLTITPAELQAMIKAEAIRLAIQVLTNMLLELTKAGEATVAT